MVAVPPLKRVLGSLVRNVGILAFSQIFSLLLTATGVFSTNVQQSFQIPIFQTNLLYISLTAVYLPLWIAIVCWEKCCRSQRRFYEQNRWTEYDEGAEVPVSPIQGCEFSVAGQGSPSDGINVCTNVSSHVEDHISTNINTNISTNAITNIGTNVRGASEGTGGASGLGGGTAGSSKLGVQEAEEENFSARLASILPVHPIALLLSFFQAFFDVQGNVLLVKAYQYTGIESVQLLDCFSVPVVMFISFVFLKVRFRLGHWIGVILCLSGVVLLVLGDILLKKRFESGWFGDVLTIIGATCYGIANIIEECMVKHKQSMIQWTNRRIYAVLRVLGYGRQRSVRGEWLREQARDTCRSSPDDSVGALYFEDSDISPPSVTSFQRNDNCPSEAFDTLPVIQSSHTHTSPLSPISGASPVSPASPSSPSCSSSTGPVGSLLASPTAAYPTASASAGSFAQPKSEIPRGYDTEASYVDKGEESFQLHPDILAESQTETRARESKRSLLSALRNIIEFLAFLGVFGLIVNTLEGLYFEYDRLADLRNISWFVFFNIVGYNVVMFSLYSLVPVFLTLFSSTLFNISVLTSDFLSVLVSIYLYRELVSIPIPES